VLHFVAVQWFFEFALMICWGREAKVRTSSATTAKPRTLFPAFAASMAAFNGPTS